MRKTKLSFDLFAQQHGNDSLFARFYQQVSKASIAKIVGVSLPAFTALSRQGGYAHTLKGYFYTNLVGNPALPDAVVGPPSTIIGNDA